MDMVTCCKVMDPTGTVVVERSKLVERPSVYAVIMRKRKGRREIVMIRGSKNRRLTLPGGAIEKGEERESALKREVWEETGLTATQFTSWWALVNYLYYEEQDVYWEVKLTIYLCEVENLDVPLTDQHSPDDEGTPEWVDLDSLDLIEVQNVFKLAVQRLWESA